MDIKTNVLYASWSCGINFVFLPFFYGAVALSIVNAVGEGFEDSRSGYHCLNNLYSIALRGEARVHMHHLEHSIFPHCYIEDTDCEATVNYYLFI